MPKIKGLDRIAFPRYLKLWKIVLSVGLRFSQWFMGPSFEPVRNALSGSRYPVYVLLSVTRAQPSEGTMHTEAKTLSARENQSSFISYVLSDGREGNIVDIQVNAFWTRVAMHPLNNTKKVKVMSNGNYSISRSLMLEEMRAYEAV